MYCLQLGTQYDAEGNSKFHDEAAAMAGQNLPDVTLDTPRHSWKLGTSCEALDDCCIIWGL
jgi:hypothetical protein